MTRWIQHNVLRWRVATVLLLGAICALKHDANGVGMAQVMTEKSLPDATVSVLDPESGTSSGTTGSEINLAEGDVILFRFAVSPVPDKRNRGIQTYLTEYVPPNTEVVGVRIIDANGRTIKPRLPGLALDGCSTSGKCNNFANLPCNAGADNCDFAGGSIAQMHADTGVFFCNDSRCQSTTGAGGPPATDFISPTNGIEMNPEPNGIGALTPLLGYSSPFYAHNQWDWTQVLAYGTSTPAMGSTTNGKGNAPFMYASPVAGPQTFYQYEATDTGANGIEFNNVVGPWNRIVYPGSMIGTGDCRTNGAVTCTPSADDLPRRAVAPTTSGTDVTPANPVTAKAVRFALGQSQTGEPVYAEVALRVTSGFTTDLFLDPNFGTGGGNIDCGEIFGSGLSVRDYGSNDGEDQPWLSYIASPQCVNLRLLLDIQVDKDLAVGEPVTYTIRNKNLALADETNVVIRQQYDGSRMTFQSANPPADGAPASCPPPYDTGKLCLTWTIGTMAPSAENNITTTFTTGGGGQTTSVTQALYESDSLPAPGYQTSALTIITGIARPSATLAHDLGANNQTNDFSSAGGTALLTGTLSNSGTNDFDFAQLGVVLPAGWTVVGDQVTIGGVPVNCTSNCGTNTPSFDYSSSFTVGNSRALQFSVNIPGGAATDLYDVDLQIWGTQTGFGGQYETYFPDLATINVGEVRTQKPTIDCPVGSTSTAVTGTSEANADISLLFNLMERGTCTADAMGVWSCTFPTFGSMYGGLEVRARAQLAGELPSELADPCEVTAKRECSDGLDNDGDGLTDFPADPGCDSPTDSTENTDASIECMDTVDNDTSGAADYPDDLSCADRYDNTEDGNPACSDGVDNDGDGLIDFPNDPDCTDANDPTERTSAQCQDRVDNDGDGLIDFPNDPGCHSAFDDSEADLTYTPTDSKPRLLIVFDTSGSMNWNTCESVFTGGDGSADCPGSDVACADLPPSCTGGSTLTCDNGVADDSRLYKVKRGVSDVIAGFGEAEYALMRFHQRDTDFLCPGRNAGLQSGGWQGGGAAPCNGGFGGGDLVVSFSPDNQQTLLKWMDNSTNYSGAGDPPSRLDWELRGTGTTPIAGTLDDALTYLTGVQGADPRKMCRPYRVVLVTDGQETCGGDPVASATALRNAGYYVSVIGFATDDAGIVAELNNIAAAGSQTGTDNAIFVDDETSLTAAIANIITSNILVELCNGIDDDCDGKIDEDYPDLGNACNNGQAGVCYRDGTIVCSADERSTECNAADGSGSATMETCNLLDDDCDEKVDEGLTCNCASTEVCNDLDDDCDGNIDEAPIAGVGDACGISIGECQQGTIQCIDSDGVPGTGDGFLSCVGATDPVQPDTCDGLDNDCDTQVDEDFAQQCYTGATGCTPDGSGGYNCAGICKPGALECVMGMPGSCIGEVTPGVEMCNGIDDDCDGTVDEDWQPDGAGNQLGATCNNGALGACYAEGVWACNTAMPSGPLVCTAPTISAGTEICNGTDDDCDGMTDEALGSPVGDACGSVGCMPGTLQCVDPDMDPLTENSHIECVGTTGGMPEVCNGVDDDCDTQIDEEVAGVGVDCYPDGVVGCTGDAVNGFTCVGECKTGTTICSPPDILCDGYVGPAAQDNCDGLDNDCDGLVDEDPMCPGPGDACVDGGCASQCEQGEFPCPFGFFCKTLDDSACTNPPCRYCLEDQCVGVTCNPGEMCDPETGNCNDPCDNTTCQTGEICFAGGCFDCFDAGFGCDQGEQCVAGQNGVGTCEVDLCYDVICGTNQFCRDGDCIDITCDPPCDSGQVCLDGMCETDMCDGVQCGQNQVCNPSTGTCGADLCLGTNCPTGQACNPDDGACIPDPCTLVSCPDGYICEVGFDGNGSCTEDTSTGEQGPLIVAAGDGGCNTGSGGSGGMLALLLLGVLFVLRRRR